MSGWLKLCNVLFWLALVFWSGALMSAGIAAMNVFGTLDDLTLTIDRYAAYPSSEHPRLAAGGVMDGVFFLVDVLRFIAIPVAIVTMVCQLAASRSTLWRAANIVRVTCLLVAAGLFVFHAAFQAPTMNHALRQYWSAAEAGDIEAASLHRAAFNVYHPRAEGILKLELILVMVGIVASAATVGPAPRQLASTLQSPRLAEVK